MPPRRMFLCAVIDKQFGTTDVLIYFPVSRIDERWLNKFDRIGT